jgi:MFS family permease
MVSPEGFAMTRSERTYYLVAGGYTFAAFFITPIYPLFLLSRGLDLFQINAILGVYLISVFLFEVPTGAVADLFGRKVSFLLSCAVRLGAYTLYTRADGFADCVVAEFIDAVGTTLASGALEAWVVDERRAEGDHRPTDTMFARTRVISRTMMVGGGVAAGYLAAWGGMVVPWLVAAAGFAVTGVLGAVLMRETHEPPGLGGSHAFGHTMFDGVRAVRATPVLLVMCLISLAMAFAAMPLYILWQPRMEALAGADLRLLGWIWALLCLAALAGSGLVPTLLRRFERHTVLCVAALWRSAMLVVAAAATTIQPALVGLVLQEMSFGLTDPVLTAWANEHVRAEQRATVLSVRSTFWTLGGAAGLSVIGLIARTFGIPTAWYVSAAVIALAAPGYLVLGRVARTITLPESLDVVAVAPGKVVSGP